MERFKIINSETDTIEYYIEVTEDSKSGGTVYTLKRSKSDVWSDHIQGEVLMSVTDDGNGLVFDKKLKSIDYAAFVELTFLTKFITTYDKTMCSGYTIEKSTVIC